MMQTAKLEEKVTELEERVKFLENRLQNNKRPRVKDKERFVIQVEDLKKLGFKGKQ